VASVIPFLLSEYLYKKKNNMAVPHNKYSMQTIIRYDGRLVDVLDRIRAISLVLMVHIEQDLGPDKELVTIKVMTPHPPRDTFYGIRKVCLGKIETLKEMTLQESSLTKLF
jgi:hypothetical protein